MNVRWAIVLADVPADQVDTSTRFWAEVTGGDIGEPEGAQKEFTPIERPGENCYVAVQALQDGVARWHLDLVVDDLAGARDHAVALGAEVVRADDGLVVLRSPAEAVFCLVTGPERYVLPSVPSFPGGHRSLVDQICLDIPADRVDTEAAFWSAFTGWEQRAGDLREFDYLVRPSDVPLRILLQRLDDPDGPARWHLDLACDDVDAEVARHTDLGARPVRRTPWWTTLRDPAGLEYCVTARTPPSPTS